MEEIAIKPPAIQLDQLLKWQGVIETGGQAKFWVEAGKIRVNGTVVSERRKKIHPGDVVEIEGVAVWKVVAGSDR